MKKKVILFVLASFLIMGAVSAASIWGTYKGMQIIRLTVDGVPVKVSDAPAVSMDGRTMIPIYLLKEAGIQYSWDQKNQTVNIIPSKGIASSVNNGNTDQIKAIVEAADFYIALENLGSMLTGLGNHLSLVFEGNNLGKGIKPDYTRLNFIIDSYNNYVNGIEAKKFVLSNQGVNISKANDILTHYYNSIESYKLAFAGMDNFINNQSEINFNNYLNNSSAGSDSAYNGMVICNDEYNAMIKRALNY